LLRDAFRQIFDIISTAKLNAAFRVDKRHSRAPRFDLDQSGDTRHRSAACFKPVGNETA
jgi:hypothetical protein